MNESLSRVFSQCKNIAARRLDMGCDMGHSSLHVFQPAASRWIKVEVAQAIGGIEQILVTEYRPGSYQQHTTCCAWEAGTLIEQLLDKGKQ
jgi:hypothetical protein